MRPPFRISFGALGVGVILASAPGSPVKSQVELANAVLQAQTIETEPQAQTIETEPQAQTIETEPQAREADATVDSITLLPGQFLWRREPPVGSPLDIVVSIPRQTLYLLADEQLIAVSSVSTGRRGHATPAGSFTVLQKKVRHFSNLYDDAPMPFMQRLTWGGVALHAGHVPGHPASHGCIRLPRDFARHLYKVTRLGTRVVVTNAPFEPAASLVTALTDALQRVTTARSTAEVLARGE